MLRHECQSGLYDRLAVNERMRESGRLLVEKSRELRGDSVKVIALESENVVDTFRLNHKTDRQFKVKVTS
jgi:hypothetical protein